MQVSFTVLLIGLSNSGKTTMINSFINKTQQIYPTAGFNINYLTSGHKSVLVYDCSGQGHSRQTWSMLYQNCDTICYMIDASDTNRFSTAKQALNKFIDQCTLQTNSIKNKCLCIMLNKWDIQNKLDKQIFIKALDLQKMQKYVSKIYVKQTSGYNKSGIQECFDWMSKNYGNTANSVGNPSNN